MRVPLRTTLTLLAAAALLPLTTLTAAAVAPPNDIPSGALPIAIGATEEMDTAEATTDAVDAAMNDQCGAPATRGSVWYVYHESDPDGGALWIDGSTSDANTGFMIIEGDPTSDGTVVSCAPFGAAAPTRAGTDYYVMAFTDVTGVPQGWVRFTVKSAPPTPTLTFSISQRGVAYKDGSVRLTGTYSCTDAESYSEISGTLTQRIGRIKISGGFYLSPLECDGQARTWEASATSENGYFAGGKAATVTVAFACGMFDCTDGYLEQTVQLSRGSGK